MVAMAEGVGLKGDAMVAVLLMLCLFFNIHYDNVQGLYTAE